MLLFFIIYICLNVVATLFYFTQGYEAYGPARNNDSVYYDYQATLIAQSGDFSIAALPYEYLVGFIYLVFGVELGPYAFKFFISIVASFSIYLIVSILGDVCINRGFTKESFNKWSKIISLIILCYPTYTFYSLNMCRDLIIVNGVLFFIYSFMNLFIYKSKRKSNYYLFLLSLLYVFILRPYFGVLMVVTVLLYIFSEKKNLNAKNIMAVLTVIIITGVSLKFTKYGMFGSNYLSRLASLESLEKYRESSSYGNLVLNIPINFHNPILFLFSYLHVFIVNHIYPLPTYIRGISNILFIPENFIVTYMLISVLKNLKGKLMKYKEIKFLLIYYFLNVGLIVAISDNIGTNIRLRLPFVLCLLIMFFIIQNSKVRRNGVSGISENNRK